MRRSVGWLLVVVVGLFALGGLWSAATSAPSASPEQITREISQTLRCPTCAGESIADSAALLSDAMRQTVAQQVSEGRSPAEIRAWFAERYGDEVLLEPPRRGYGWLLWGAPLVLVGAAVVVLTGRRRRSHALVGAGLAAATVMVLTGVWLTGTQDDVTLAGAAHDDDWQPDALAVLRDAAHHAPGDAGLRLALAGALEQSGDTPAAAEQYAAATRLRPLDPDTRYRLAFALARDQDAEGAIAVLEETLGFAEDHAPSVLLLGALLRDGDPQRATALLEQFLELQPDHPAAAEVAELLAGERDEPPAQVWP